MSKNLAEAQGLLDDKLGSVKTTDVNPRVVDQYFESIDEKILAEQVQGALNEYCSIIRRKVLEEDRIDVLAEEVLGYDLEEHHSEILASQQAPIDGRQMTLAFRGAGKSTVGTVARTIFEILKNPNIRILIGSNTQLQAEIFLREIKAHFESNDKLKQIFGEYVGPKWDAREIVVKGRTKQYRESTVTCIGVGGPTASRHYDLLILDDLVDEENSRTELQRERLQIWYYKSLMPTLLSGGRILLLGTRWHPKDLYGYIIKNTPLIRVLIIPAIRESGVSAWPSEWPIDKLLRIKAEVGVPIFETQYQMNTNAMEGKIFSFDSFFWYENLPQNLIRFQGCDLAISKNVTSDFFSFCTIGLDPNTGKIYVVDIHRGRKTFREQEEYIQKQIFRHDPIKVGIEANQYQAALVGSVQEKFGKGKILGVYTQKDKVTRAMKLAAKCENEDILFHKSQMNLIEELMAMPEGEHDDMFDALDIAYTACKQGVRKKRANEPGLM